MARQNEGFYPFGKSDALLVSVEELRTIRSKRSRLLSPASPFQSGHSAGTLWWDLRIGIERLEPSNFMEDSEKRPLKIAFVSIHRTQDSRFEKRLTLGLPLHSCRLLPF